MFLTFILSPEGLPVPEPNLLAWGLWIATHDRHVAYDQVEDIRVSTVFLGVVHDRDALYETALIDPEGLIQITGRYALPTLALEGHRRELARLHQTRELAQQVLENMRTP